jgi:hypothetical protein
MLRKKTWLGVLALAGLLAGAAVVYLQWRGNEAQRAHAEILSLLPGDAETAAFLDLRELRSTPFLAQFIAWAPRPAMEKDYEKFVQATGFDYERDLDRLAVAMKGTAPSATLLVIGEGRFDRKKIEAYGAQFGNLKTANGKTIYAVPMNGASRPAYFTFLRDDRVAWSNDVSFFFQKAGAASPADWREHFSRVAGTPLFAILRRDSSTVSSLAQQAPGGFRSPQLATLLGQLDWISIGGKPEGDVLRVVIDGESHSEATVRQLKELLGGVLILAEAGLNDPKTRKQLDPQLRDACLELVRSVEVQKMDRGTSKSVRIIFEVTPKLLQTARVARTAEDPR